MKKILFFRLKGSPSYSSIFFGGLLLSISLLGSFILEFNSTELKVLFTGILSVWLLFKIIFPKLDSLPVTPFDFGLLCGLLYMLLHYFLFSEVSFYDATFWSYLSYLFSYFIFRWSFNKDTRQPFYIYAILLLFIAICSLESMIAILQNFDYLHTKNPYFKLLGSFSSPNFLGAYLGLGFCVLIWFLFVVKITQKKWIGLGIVGLLLFAVLIVFTKSRASWLATLASITLLLFTSKKINLFLKKTSLLKKTIVVFALLILIVGASKFLYSLKPESVKGRLLVAKITLQEVAKKPILGHGLFSFAGGYNKAKATYFTKEERPWSEVKNGTYVFTPFNDYLLIAYEIGLVGLLLIMSILLFSFLKTDINRYTRIGMALVVNVLVLALFSSPLSSIPIMLIAIVGFSIVSAYGHFFSISFALTKTLKTGVILILFFVSILGIYASTSKFTGMKKYQTYRALSKDSIKIERLQTLSKYSGNSGVSKGNLGAKLYKLGYKQEGLTLMEKAFNTTLAPKIGQNLATCYLKKGNYKRAVEIYESNIGTEPYRYKWRMDLLEVYKRSNRYKEITKLSQEIVDLPTKIPSKKIDTYKKRALKNIKSYGKRSSTQKKLTGSLSAGKIWNSKILDKKLSYKIYLPSLDKITKKLPVIYVNDGYSYIKKGEFPSIVDSLIVNNIIEPVAVVFLEPKDGNQKWKNVRQELFLCNPKFVTFFTKEFIPLIERKYPVSKKRENRTILGVSFGGLAAAYFGNKATHTFKNVAMQSPAFHPRKNIYSSYANSPMKDLKVYLSYGTGKDTEKQDLPMIALLKNKKYDLKVERIENGEHRWDTWKPQLKNILLYYFEKHNSESN